MSENLKEKLDELWNQVMHKSIELYLQDADFKLQMSLIKDEIIKEKVRTKHERTMNSLASEWSEIKNNIIKTVEGEKGVKSKKK